MIWVMIMFATLDLAVAAAIACIFYEDTWSDRWERGEAIPWSEVLAVLFWPVGMPALALARNHQRLKRIKARANAQPEPKSIQGSSYR